mmetsp:Transcript_14469/g.45588  ORF Transcript_14469/g.45588 Transcript_14469/m.45588 type:complete len:170 (+) Transcript_14469:86-595(+)|eukprot:CAMPEP_0197391490 /NCGR_PEP_ID=MMETSP1165-20131217/3134_1 /TAXON_ID=284809 /ORGANISM="Chrysocystis fragilis, Strain CCMP3189" /LENGTH=169 /DNA_ID=CAMNT_0042917079 /DNA_START=68 /DNA_END=577 /DNA_ORIENTATION=+
MKTTTLIGLLAVVGAAFQHGAGSRRSVRAAASAAAAPESVVQMAQEQTKKLRQMLGALAGPPELERLEAGISSGASTEELGVAMFDLLVTMTLDFRNQDSGAIEPVEEPGGSLPQSDEVRQKLQYLYTYGIRMMTTGLLSVDSLKDLVLKRLAARVGMDGKELDDWLDV